MHEYNELKGATAGMHADEAQLSAVAGEKATPGQGRMWPARIIITLVLLLAIASLVLHVYAQDFQIEPNAAWPLLWSILTVLTSVGSPGHFQLALARCHLCLPLEGRASLPSRQRPDLGFCLVLYALRLVCDGVALQL
jgi:hypothetical protein